MGLFFMKHKAFTLAEIMIVLTIIGVLTMILLPIANHSRPDEAVMKFKKADTTLKNVIRELVNSDKYYVNGDLGMKRLPNGTSQLIDGNNEGDQKYLCQTIADVLNTKSVNCAEGNSGFNALVNLHDNPYEDMDYRCGKVAEAGGSSSAEIIMSDDVIFYRVNPYLTFGADGKNVNYHICHKQDGSNIDNYYDWCDSYKTGNRHFLAEYNGFLDSTIVVCLDIDGINKGEGPFGYAIRVDGKVVAGKRATEWLEKGFQKGSNEN